MIHVSYCCSQQTIKHGKVHAIISFSYLQSLFKWLKVSEYGREYVNIRDQSCFCDTDHIEETWGDSYDAGKFKLTGNPNLIMLHSSSMPSINVYMYSHHGALLP